MGRRKKRKHGEYGDTPDEMARWAEDFYLGYLYDPDGKLVGADMERTPKSFLKAVDGAIQWIPAMTDKECEQLVSRVLQWKRRMAEEADIRLVEIGEMLEERSDWRKEDI